MPTTDPIVSQLLCRLTGASDAVAAEQVQELWSGYGRLMRYHLIGASRDSIIVKDIDLQAGEAHPRGWNTDIGHQRKLRSYEIEARWYRDWAHRCGESCRIPTCLGAELSDTRIRLVLEDLDSAGFPGRKHHAGWPEAVLGLRWLAAFHGTFIGESPEGLWPTGTYWHLDTRPDEWAKLPAGPLKDHAAAIDTRLGDARHQTLVHGDAKLANFCFTPDGGEIAAVDFQYVGGGCGMKDVAYFVGSIFDEDACEELETDLLEVYFDALRVAVPAHIDSVSLEKEWRDLYPVAWTDFYRFLQGWSPGHWKLHRYSERLARRTLDTFTP